MCNAFDSLKRLSYCTLYSVQQSYNVLSLDLPSLVTLAPHVLHPTKEGQFPRDPIFFGQTPHP